MTFSQLLSYSFLLFILKIFFLGKLYSFPSGSVIFLLWPDKEYGVFKEDYR